MSNQQGAGEEKRGQQYFTTAFILNLLAGLIYINVFFAFGEEIMLFLGGTSVKMPYIMGYAPYIAGGALIFAFHRFYRPLSEMTVRPGAQWPAVIAGGVFNIVFDILLVFPF